MVRKIYKKGMEFFQNETKQKILFGKWTDTDKNIASCITMPQRGFVNLSKEDLNENYTSVSSLEREARERSRGQCWRGM
jgi:hypothetical protein